jgi:hypothetical protein
MSIWTNKPSTKTKNQQTPHKTTNKHNAAQNDEQTQRRTKTAKTQKTKKQTYVDNHLFK